MRRVTNGRILHFASAALLASGVASASETQPQRLWSYEMPNETYSNYSVSIGDGGSQVFSDTGKWTRRTRLFAGTEAGDVSPTWEASNSTTRTYNQMVASAEENDAHFTLYQTDGPTGSLSRYATLDAYRSHDSQPVWSYQFPIPITNHDRMMVDCSEDASKAVVVIQDTATSEEEVWVFDGGPQSPMHFQADLVGWFKYGRLSSDGSRLYLNSESRAKVFNTDTGAQLHEHTIYGGTFTGHAISGDGRTFAFSRWNGAEVYERSTSTSYALADAFTGSSTEYVNTIELSSDGDIVVLGYSDATANTSRIKAVRRSTGAVLLEQSYQGIGPYTNWPRDISMSENGDRIAIAMTGDGLASSNTPEVVVFQRQVRGWAGSSYQLLWDWECVGSRMELEISADGNRLAVCGRDTHASSSSGTKLVENYHLGADLLLTGTPRQGGSLSVTYRPEAFPNAWLIVSRDRFDAPTFTTAGPLWLDRSNGLQFVNLTYHASTGEATGSFPLLSSYQAGTQLYVQAYSAGPQRRLSQTMQALTVLP